jgi:hypothetical protein
MSRLKNSAAGLAVLLCAASLPALAESSASSAASGSVSTSVGSLSTSLQKSSDGSSKGTDVADGDYRIIELAAAADRPGTLRLTLQAQAGGSDEPFFLYLPEQTVERSQLAQGGTVTARQRAYGVEFSRGDRQEAFFLVMADDWYRELQTNVVRL